MKNDWSLKHLHRSILLSATYRQQSHSADEPNASLVPTTTTAVSSVRESNFARSLKADPENRLLGRYPRRRLTGEMLRDAMLQAAGDLNRQSSGPSVMPPLPDEMVRTLLPGQWKTSSTISDHHRRSIYIFARRNLRYPIFDSFDRPDAGASCPERGKSTTATQSLLMFNSAFSLQIAESISDQAIQHSLQRTVQSANPSDGGSPFTRQQAESVWESILLRRPTDSEYKLLEQFAHRVTNGQSVVSKELQSNTHAKTHYALTLVALALLNSNEFLTLD